MSSFVAGTIDILRFAFDRLLRAVYWTFHVLRLPNVNVVVPLRFASHARAGLEASCVAATKHECCSYMVQGIALCSTEP